MSAYPSNISILCSINRLFRFRWSYHAAILYLFSDTDSLSLSLSLCNETIRSSKEERTKRDRIDLALGRQKVHERVRTIRGIKERDKQTGRYGRKEGGRGTVRLFRERRSYPRVASWESEITAAIRGELARIRQLNSEFQKYDPSGQAAKIIASAALDWV